MSVWDKLWGTEDEKNKKPVQEVETPTARLERMRAELADLKGRKKVLEDDAMQGAGESGRASNSELIEKLAQQIREKEQQLRESAGHQ